uniref:Uncharacterized protein n=1 Tax=Arundo donax TaxID=35708 RepID=A0A0A9GY64_ARUDO
MLLYLRKWLQQLLLLSLLNLCQFMLLDQSLKLWVLLSLEMKRTLTMEQLLNQLMLQYIILPNINP